MSILIFLNIWWIKIIVLFFGRMVLFKLIIMFFYMFWILILFYLYMEFLVFWLLRSLFVKIGWICIKFWFGCWVNLLVGLNLIGCFFDWINLSKKYRKRVIIKNLKVIVLNIFNISLIMLI